LENTDYEVALANSDFAAIVKQGMLLTNHFAPYHPSQPNYVGLISGSDLGITDDSVRDLDVGNASVADSLEAAGLTWGAFQEEFPGHCNTSEYIDGDPTVPGIYFRRHNPFILFKSIQSDPKRCGNIVNASAFWDLLHQHSLPSFSFYTPNSFNNGHDTGIGYAGTWLTKFVAQLKAAHSVDPEPWDLVIVITFDEGDSVASHHNHVATVILDWQNPHLAGTTDSATYSHFSLLRALEINWELPSLRADTSAIPVNYLAPTVIRTPRTPSVPSTHAAVSWSDANHVTIMAMIAVGNLAVIVALARWVRQCRQANTTAGSTAKSRAVSADSQHHQALLQEDSSCPTQDHNNESSSDMATEPAPV